MVIYIYIPLYFFVTFCRDWADYRDGFGNYELWNDEFWLGNENIHSVLLGGKTFIT